jgi:hypothetical protein
MGSTLSGDERQRLHEGLRVGLFGQAGVMRLTERLD